MLLSIYLSSCLIAYLISSVFAHQIAQKDRDMDFKSASFLNIIFSIILSFFWFLVMIYFFYTITLKIETRPKNM